MWDLPIETVFPILSSNQGKPTCGDPPTLLKRAIGDYFRGY